MPIAPRPREETAGLLFFQVCVSSGSSFQLGDDAAFMYALKEHAQPA